MRSTFPPPLNRKNSQKSAFPYINTNQYLTMVSKKEIQAAWYISPHKHQITVSNSQDIKALVESLLNVVPPSFDPDNSIKHLRTDTGFILHSTTNFSGASLSPLYADDLRSKAPQEATEAAPRVQHSLECFMRFYMTSFHAPRDENAATEALHHPDGSMASYMAGLLADCSQDLASPCDGMCRSAYASLDETQVEGLLYVSNLVTGYILGCMVGSEIAEGLFCDQFRQAWPRIQGLLSTGRDEAGLRVPLMVKGGHGPLLPRL